MNTGYTLSGIIGIIAKYAVEASTTKVFIGIVKTSCIQRYAHDRRMSTQLQPKPNVPSGRVSFR